MQALQYFLNRGMDRMYPKSELDIKPSTDAEMKLQQMLSFFVGEPGFSTHKQIYVAFWVNNQSKKYILQLDLSPHVCNIICQENYPEIIIFQT